MSNESATQSPLSNRGSTILKKVAGGFFVLISAIASAIGIWSYYISGKPRIDANIVRIEHLTAPSVDGKLTVSYQYDGKPVTNLWRVRLNLINSSNQTVISLPGDRQNAPLGIPISVKRPAIILNFNTEPNTVNASAARATQSAAGAGSVHVENTILLSFEQWLSGESVAVDLYIEIPSNARPTPALFEPRRPINDGFFEYRVPDENNRPKKPLLDFLPPSLALTLRILVSCVSLLIVAPLSVLTIVSTISEAQKRKRIALWRKEHLAQSCEQIKKKIGDRNFSLLESELFNVTDETFIKIVGTTPKVVLEGVSNPPDNLSWLGKEPPRMQSDIILLVGCFVLMILVSIAAPAALWSF